MTKHCSAIRSSQSILDGPIHQARFMPGEDLVAVMVRQPPSVQLLNWANGTTQTIPLPGPSVETPFGRSVNMLFGPTGKTLTLHESGQIATWQLKPKPTLVFDHNEPFATPATVSPSGRFLALICSDQTARIVDLKTGDVITRVQDEEQILCCSFSSDEEYLATGSGDFLERPMSNSTRIWEIPSGREVFRLTESRNPINISFDEQSDRLVVQKSNSAISVYRWKAADLVPEVNRRLQHKMDLPTWQALLPGVEYKTAFDHLPVPGG